MLASYMTDSDFEKQSMAEITISDYKQTTKQDNKEINKQATYARLSRLLHILHPLGIKVRHQ